MRRCNVHDIKKFLIDIRLIAPCIYDYCSKLRNCCYECFLINDLSS